MSARFRFQALLIVGVTIILFFFIHYSSNPGRHTQTLEGGHGTSAAVSHQQPAAWIQPGVLSNATSTVTVVVPRLKREDVSWVNTQLPHFQTAIYTVDDKSASLHPPRNKGNEAMVYLSYIIDFYHQLPDVSIFIHAHRWAWHNSDVMDNDMAFLLQQLNLDYVRKQGYMNLRCQTSPGCPDYLHPAAGLPEDASKKEEALIAAVWPELFSNKPLPEVLAQPCCSQFAVTRERILSNAKADYERLRDWLTHTKIRDSMSGRIFEYTWQVLFTGEPVACPSERACHCDMYGLCFEDEDAFTSFMETRLRLRTEEWDVLDAEEAGSTSESEIARRKSEIALGHFKHAALRSKAFERGSALHAL